MGDLQDPKMEVLYHIRPYFAGIIPYIGHGLFLPSGPFRGHLGLPSSSPRAAHRGAAVSVGLGMGPPVELAFSCRTEKWLNSIEFMVDII